MMDKELQLKVTIAKLIEVSYSKEKGFVKSAIAEKGRLKIKVNQSGKVILTAKGKNKSFYASPEMIGLGTTFKMASVTVMSKGEDIRYSAKFYFWRKAASVAINGTINFEKLILSCSGLLCRSARAMKESKKRIENGRYIR